MASPTAAGEGEVLKKIEDQLECAVCLQPFTDPKLLLCFHAFCLRCIEGMVGQDPQGAPAQVVVCPKCRHSTPVPDLGIKTLQSAFHIHHLFDIRDMLRKVNEPQETKCEKCKEGSATHFCRDCGKFVCANCTEIHRKWDELSTHEVVSIDEIQPDGISSAPPRVTYCDKHPASTLQLYCKTCQELICTDCTIRFHHGHQYDLVTDTFPKYRDEIQTHLQTVRQHLSTVNEGLSELNREMKEVAEQKVALEADIDEQTNQLHRALDQRKAELIGQLNNVTQQKLKSLAAQRDEVEMIQAQLSSCLEYMEGSLQPGMEGQALSMKAQVLQQVQQVTAKVNPDHLNPNEIADTVLENNLSRVIEVCQNFAGIRNIDLQQCFATGVSLETTRVSERVDIKLHTKHKDGKDRGIRPEDITAQLVCCESGEKMWCEVRKAKGGQFNIRYWPSTNGQHQLNITIWGRHTRGSPHSVAVQPFHANIVLRR